MLTALNYPKDGHLGMLTKKSATSVGTEMTSESQTKLPKTIPKGMAKLHEQRRESVEAHRDMLGTIYHLAPAFSHEYFDKTRSSMLPLATVADMYGVHLVTNMHIGSHRCLCHTEVLDICVINPVAMLELALPIRSGWIFMEAAAHCIGISSRTL